MWEGLGVCRRADWGRGRTAYQQVGQQPAAMREEVKWDVAATEAAAESVVEYMV